MKYKAKGYYRNTGVIERPDTKQEIAAITKATLKKKNLTTSDIMKLVELAYNSGRDDGILTGVDRVFQSNPKCRKCEVRVKM